MLLAGRVSVNGAVVRRLGTQVDADHDRIEVDTRPLATAPRERVVLAIHKPRRMLTTLADPEGRATILDLLSGYDRRVFPVGRLDWDADGLVLLTDDGELAHRLMHPSFAVPRTYRVKVRGRATPELLRRLDVGIRLDDGLARAEKARILAVPEKNSWIELTVREGRNHLVKRMLDAHGFPVLRIHRTAYATVRLGDLAPGHWRRLTNQEIEELHASLSDESARPSADRPGPLAAPRVGSAVSNRGAAPARVGTGPSASDRARGRRKPNTPPKARRGRPAAESREDGAAAPARRRRSSHR